MSYWMAVPIIFIYLLIRVWWLHSRRIALGFLALWIFANYVPPALHLPALISPLTVIGLAMILYMIDRYKSAPPLR